MKCSNEAFLDSTGFCLPRPQGIAGCIFYEKKDVCLACKPGMYLANNQCFRVEEDALIDNCQIYEDALSCKRCKKGFFLRDNACLKTSAKNCDVALDEKSCESCQIGQKLEKQGELNNCVELSSPNCTEFDILGD